MTYYGYEYNGRAALSQTDTPVYANTAPTPPAAPASSSNYGLLVHSYEGWSTPNGSKYDNWYESQWVCVITGSSPAVGDPAYPSGLPVYIAPTSKVTTGRDNSVTIMNKTYTFKGGVGVPAAETTYNVQFMLGEGFGYSLDLSDDGRFLAASSKTRIPRKRAGIVNTSPTGSLRIQSSSLSLADKTYTADQSIQIPDDATSLTLTGKGNDGGARAAIPGLDSNVTGNSSLAIPAGITSVAIKAKRARMVEPSHMGGLT